MQRVTQSNQKPSSSTYNINTQRVYTRFHRKPQIYQPNCQTNKTIKLEQTIDQESMNDYMAKIYKEKKYRGVLDPSSPNNKDIFIDTDSEHQKSEIGADEYNQRRKNKKSTRLLIEKTESQYPETYNSQNIFRRDGIIKGYYVKVNRNTSNQLYNTYNLRTRNERIIKNFVQTPTKSKKKYIYESK